MKSSRRNLGLTVPEVLIAIAMIGVLVAVFSTALTGNIRILSKTSNQTQGAELMGYLGKQIVDGDALLLATEESPLVWDYGELSSAFGDLKDPKNYRVTVTHDGTVSLSTASITQYKIEVCNMNSGGEACITAVTFGPSIDEAGQSSALNGIS